MMDELRSNDEHTKRRATLSRSLGWRRGVLCDVVDEALLKHNAAQRADALDGECSLHDLASLRCEQSAGIRMMDSIFPERSSQSSASPASAERRLEISSPFTGERGDSLSDVELSDRAKEQPDIRLPSSHSTIHDTNPDGHNVFVSAMPEQTFPDPGPYTHVQRRKGECHLCSRIRRLHEKETCLVCQAKYCHECVLKAMGSMPEGRKCVGCVGQLINESKRPNLGKPSRLLNRLLPSLEVQQIMKTERDCTGNQLRPEQVYVNGQRLRPDELAVLLTCSNLLLKPGRYWYDKQTGYWGKEGEKPDKIITAELNVGGLLQEDASAGSTKVYMNDREITKRELKMLKFAGVECVRGKRLWVYQDGQIQEEGQKAYSGNIWGKARTKFLYSLLALPTPNSGGTDVVSHGQSAPEYPQQTMVHKVLLLGLEGSGASTIFKQAKFLSGDVGFTQEELKSLVWRIQSNIYKYISVLLEAREHFEDEEERAKARKDEPKHPQMEFHVSCSSGVKPIISSSAAQGESVQGLRKERKNVYALGSRLKGHADRILETVANGHLHSDFLASVHENTASVVEELWKDPAIQETYRRKDELHMLPYVAEYFLEKVVDVWSNYYVPTNQDILYAEGVMQGSGLMEIEFSLNEMSSLETHNEDDDFEWDRYQLISIKSRGVTETSKWLDMFEDVEAVMFCVGLDSYHQMGTDGTVSLQNRMMLTRKLFDNVVNHSCFRGIPIILLLNKYDAFEEKVQSVPLTICEWFSDFHPVQTSDGNVAKQAYTYIAHKFKKHYEKISNLHRKLHTFQLIAWDETTVSVAFQYVKEVLKWEFNKWNVIDESIYSSDPSDFCQFVHASDH